MLAFRNLIPESKLDSASSKYVIYRRRPSEERRKSEASANPPGVRRQEGSPKRCLHRIDLLGPLHGVVYFVPLGGGRSNLKSSGNTHGFKWFLSSVVE